MNTKCIIGENKNMFINERSKEEESIWMKLIGNQTKAGDPQKKVKNIETHGSPSLTVTMMSTLRAVVVRAA
jgi:hypothetical protein